MVSTINHSLSASFFVIKDYLFAPGPTPVPSRVLLAMAQPIIHHRTPQFSAIFSEVLLAQMFIDGIQTLISVGPPSK